MMDARDLVIRWLEEPVEAACVLCKSKKLKKFYKGPVVSLVSGELVCPMCAATYNKNLHDVCLIHAQCIREHDWEMPIDDLSLDGLNSMDPIKLDDNAFSELDKYDAYQELRYDEPLLNRVDKCAGCAHTYQVKSDPKRK